jgi:hypothetical protein
MTWWMWLVLGVVIGYVWRSACGSAFDDYGGPGG